MTEVGEAIRQLGFAALVGGFGIYIVSVIWRPLEYVIRRKFSPRVMVVGFYARAVGTLGMVAVLLGGVLVNPGSWPGALLIFLIFGAPAIALLVWRPVRSKDFGFQAGSPYEKTEAPIGQPPSVHSGESTPGDETK